MQRELSFLYRTSSFLIYLRDYYKLGTQIRVAASEGKDSQISPSSKNAHGPRALPEWAVGAWCGLTTSSGHLQSYGGTYVEPSLQNPVRNTGVCSISRPIWGSHHSQLHHKFAARHTSILVVTFLPKLAWATSCNWLSWYCPTWAVLGESGCQIPIYANGLVQSEESCLTRRLDLWGMLKSGDPQVGYILRF